MYWVLKYRIIHHCQVGADIVNHAEVKSWWKVNITVFYTRFLSLTDQKYAESSAFWQVFYYCSPSIQQEWSLKCDAKNSTYIY